VAIFTLISRADVIHRFAGCNAIVMTGGATAHDIGVVDANHRRPVAAPVTVFAQVIGLNMSGVFTGSSGTVMAADAIPADAGMVKYSSRPTIGTVAIITAGAGGNM
jgi:hypothetical protein